MIANWNEKLFSVSKITGNIPFFCAEAIRQFLINDFPVFEENDNLDNAIIFTQYEDAIKYRSLFIEYTKEKKKETDERHANGIFTIGEIAKKLGISETDLKIIDSEENDYMFYDGTRPEDFGEIDTY